MAQKTNAVCTLKVRQIEKNQIFELGMLQKDVKRYEKAVSEYGNVVPVIVGMADGAYRILDGQARLEACARAGISEMHAIVSTADGEVEQMKLALLLSTIREEGGAISEGEFINELISTHGVTRRELTKFLGKSKAWLSKRQALAVNLSDSVKGMVADGAVCARTAEEIAKLPIEFQTEFATNAVREGLSKTDVGQLVRLYRMPQTSDECRKAIIESPMSVLSTLPETYKRPARQKVLKSASERIAWVARYAVRLLYELKQLIAAADDISLTLAGYYLRDLREAITDLDVALRREAIYMDVTLKDAAGNVSPGKREGWQTL